MSDTAPEEKKTAPDGIARSLEEKERKNSGERPETKGDEPADNTRQRALSQCIEYLEDGESEYSHPADMAEHLENLSLKEQVCLFRHLPADEAAEALAELDQEVAVDVLENLDPDEAAQIIAEMSHDDAADVLDELEEGHRDVLLSNLDRDDAEELRNLLAFDPDTAGGIMNTEIILLEQDITVDEAISLIRRGMEEDMEIPYYAYVVDEDDKLVGVFSLRDLMLSKPGTILRDSLHDQDVIAVRYDTSSEEVARRMSHYNFMAMPVVDYEGRLLGVATYDDILDIMQDEASADLLGMVGAGQDETVDTPWLESVQIRLPWLIVNMVTSMMSAFVVYMFEGSIAGMALLAVLMPMVANQAGNTGQQALAVMIRQLATEKFDRKRAWIAVLREGKIGIASGVIMAMLACVGVWFTSSSPELGMVMGAALMGDMLLGALAGGSIPLIFRAVGRDPAQASSIFLTAITDSAGFFIFLGLATAFLLLKSRFGVEAELSPARVPYRETIKKKVEAHGRHKKQTGGSGQFGDVWIRFEPQYESEDMIFAEEVFGGSVPKNFFPAVEKGLREAAQKGVLAGYPLVNLKATLYDGSYHPVDSNEMAFKTAAQLAYKEGIANANPVILEPIGALEVTIPDSYLGDVMGDLNKRRGRVMGMNPTEDGNQILEAEVPMAEMTSYAIDLRSLTQSRGSFSFHFVRYEEAPPAAQQKAIEDAKAIQEEN